jgi:hypothetical protein
MKHLKYNTHEVCLKSNENDFLFNTERPGQESGNRGRWGNQVQSLTPLRLVRAFVTVGRLGKCVLVFYRVTRENAEGFGAALRNYVLRKTRKKIWVQNVSVVENRVYGMFFCVHCNCTADTVIKSDKVIAQASGALLSHDFRLC